jgi:23S rRNA (uracil1939-C5)-methyltransferase
MASEPGELADIESLSPEGRGVAHIDGKVVFIDGALEGERVRFKRVRKRGRFDEGSILEVITASAQRVTPKCPHAAVCGGCSLQHLDAHAQILHKQQVLIDQLLHVANATPTEVLPPLSGPTWGYRNKARLGAKHVPKKGGTLVGFREKRKAYIADIEACVVLHPMVGSKLIELRHLIDQLSRPDRVPQIEVAIGDSTVALVIRHLSEITAQDRDVLHRFGVTQDFDIYLQPGGPETTAPLGKARQLNYALTEHNVNIDFQPTDFTQVNPELNRKMVDMVISLLDPGVADRVLDLFCGLGNFTLPIARRVKHIVGVEGNEALVQRSTANASANDISNAAFIRADLSVPGGTFLKEAYDLVLLDPPRTGAREILETISLAATRRVVYVSCNPSTLARDTAILVERHGLQLQSAGVIDMFPHTSHVESVAVFER